MLSSKPNPIPAIPPYVLIAPHLEHPLGEKHQKLKSDTDAINFFLRKAKTTKKNFFEKKKENGKMNKRDENMKGESPSNGLFFASCPTKPKHQICTEENLHFYNRNFPTIFSFIFFGVRTKKRTKNIKNIKKKKKTDRSLHSRGSGRRLLRR